MTILEQLISELRERNEEYIKKNALGLVCECGGGGTDKNNVTCGICGGCGIYRWEVYKIDQITTDTAHAVALAVIESIRQNGVVKEQTETNTMDYRDGDAYGMNKARQYTLDHLTTLEAKIKDV